MTREEEIKQQTFVYYETCSDEDILKSKGFIDGAKWADKTMIEKACKWITKHISIPYEGGFIDDSPVASDYIEWCEKRLEKAKAIADSFKKAMEE